jgi:hypothetical protein
MTYAQGLTKTGKGESTVLFRGNNIGLNLGESELSFSINNIDKTVGQSGRLFYSVSGSGKNEEGLSGLFDGGDFVPSAQFTGIAGYSFSNGTFPDVDLKIHEIAQRQTKFEQRFIKSFKADMTAAINNNTRGAGLAALKQKLFDQLSRVETYDKFEAATKADAQATATEKLALDALNKVYQRLDTSFKKTIADFDTEYNDAKQKERKSAYWQIMPYLYLSESFSQFKLITKIDTSNFNDSFEDKRFRGTRAGIGLNLQLGFVMIGATYGTSHSSSFSLLTKKEYTLRTTQSNATQSLIAEKKITGYEGNYEEVNIREFNLDLIFNIKLDDERKNHLLVDPYYRAQFNSASPLVLPNSRTVGIGAYFFQQTGKFLGGLYVELPDIDNNYEKVKPESKQHLRKPGDRLSFGIASKFSLSSVLSLF